MLIRRGLRCVWACGVSLYRMTTGIVPFEGSSLMHLFENIAKGDFEIPAAILHDAPLVALLRGLLTVEQEQRLSVANALEHAWVRERDDSMRWGEHERLLVASISRGSLVDGKGWDAVNSLWEYFHIGSRISDTYPYIYMYV